jgi:type VI secretion system lysozyme-like protein
MVRAPRRVAPTPLFDRLVSQEPKQTRAQQRLSALDRIGLEQSIARELQRLLNTRTRRPRKQVDENFRTTLDYGVHDHYVLNPRSEEDRQQLAKELQWAISRFEPRLRLVKVLVDPPGPGSRHLIIRIDAKLNTEHVKEPVAFQLTSEGGDLVGVKRLG